MNKIPKGDAMTAMELYNSEVKSLPASDRLQLAALILNDIPPEAVADYDDCWSDEDLQDLTQGTWGRAFESEGEKDVKTR